jgi:hypothetical protein
MHPAQPPDLNLYRYYDGVRAPRRLLLAGGFSSEGPPPYYSGVQPLNTVNHPLEPRTSSHVCMFAVMPVLPRQLPAVELLVLF